MLRNGFLMIVIPCCLCNNKTNMEGVILHQRKGEIPMKKLLSILMAMVLCMSLTAVSAEEAGYVETVVTIDAGDHQIPATICAPTAEGVYPAVVMLHGTGSSRDEAGNGYKMAAPVMAEKYGIVTIRFDFMGSGESTADYANYNYTTAVADAVVCAEYVGAMENVDADKIGVMGWSQGGTNALSCAGRRPDVFKSVVTWAGAPELGLLMTDELYEEAKANGYFVMNFDWREPLNVGLQWCEDVKNVDVLGEFAAFTGPVLALHGTADVVVDPEWSNKIVATSTNELSRASFIEGMDHTFNVFSEPEFTSLYNAVDQTGAFFAETLK